MARTKVKRTRRQKIKENGDKPRAKSKYALKIEKRREQRKQK